MTAVLCPPAGWKRRQGRAAARTAHIVPAEAVGGKMPSGGWLQTEFVQAQISRLSQTFRRPLGETLREEVLRGPYKLNKIKILFNLGEGKTLREPFGTLSDKPTPSGSGLGRFRQPDLFRRSPRIFYMIDYRTQAPQSCGIFWLTMRPSKPTPSALWTNTFWTCGISSAISSSSVIRPWRAWSWTRLTLWTWIWTSWPA